jgi:hypothetical protein
MMPNMAANRAGYSRVVLDMQVLEKYCEYRIKERKGGLLGLIRT